MKSYLIGYDHQKLDQNSDSKHKRSLGSKLRASWHTLLAWLGTSSEPRVWSNRDRTGRLSWSAYDPLTNQRMENLSDGDMRIWLEERHYHDRILAQRKFQQFKISHLRRSL